MCGIAGHISRNTLSQNDLEAFPKMLWSLKHRGPNNTDQWLSDDKKLILGHTRLSILDLSSAGNQPMKSISQKYVISFNGEIYNHLELRKKIANKWVSTSDTETLLACIESWGLSKTLELVEGMFAFALYDVHEKKLFLCRDRFGEKPLYYGSLKNTKNDFIFSSEISAISSRLDFKSELNVTSLSRVLKYNNTGSSETIFLNLSKLPPASFLEYDIRSNSYEIFSYWSAVETALNAKQFNENIQYDDAVLQAEILLKNTVKKQMLSDVPIGCFLSGGIDSSTVSALMQSESNKPINTFTIGNHDSEIDEASNAKKIANHLGTSHHELYLTENDIVNIIPEALSLYGEPFADSSQIPTLLISKLAKQSVSVALTGDAGDEMFGGYNRHLFVQKYWPKVKKIPLPLRSFLSKSNLANSIFGRLMPLVGYDVKYENIYLKLQKIFNAIDSRDLNNLYDNFLTSNGYYHCLKSQSQVIENFNLKYTKLTDFELMMLFDVISYLPNDILTKVDRASMSYSLETRAPYLNHHLYEFMCKLPSSFKIKNGKTKRILRSINKKYIPEDLIDQRKVGFGIPIANWMRGKLFEFSHAMVFNNDLKNLNIVDETKLQKIWDDHQSKEYDYSSILWNFVALGAWFDRQKK